MLDNRRELSERMAWIEHELHQAPPWKRWTSWGKARIHELQACHRQRELIAALEQSKAEVQARVQAGLQDLGLT